MRWSMSVDPRRSTLALITACVLGAGVAEAQSPPSSPYQGHAALQSAMRALNAAHPSRTQLVTIATSPGGRAVQALRVGSGANVATRPALLVVANAWGPHLVGSAVALESATRLLNGYASDAAVKTLLDQHTIWFIPRLNPDAAEALTGSVKELRTMNNLAGGANPAGGVDLDRNGWITAMRIRDPKGEWIADPTEPALMRRANTAAGERGVWRFHPVEGRTSDTPRYPTDLGGADLNRNFAHNYPHHGAEAGIYSMSEPEARGLGEFLIAHPEIVAAHVLGPQDNLLTPWQNRPNNGILNPTSGQRATEGTSAGGPLQSIMAGDQGTFAALSQRYQAVTGVARGAAGAASEGDLLSYLYYITGRWAVGTRGWSIPEAAPSGAAGGRGGAAQAEERNAIAWYRAQGLDPVVPWRSATLPGESAEVEVGGVLPGITINPPAGAALDSVLAQQHRFITTLAGMLPRITMKEPVVVKVGDGVWRVTVELVNEGGLPTATTVANRMRSNFPALRLIFDHGAAVLQTGTARVEVLAPIPAGGSIQRSWTMVAPAGTSLTFTARAPTAGTATQSITLR